MRYNKFKSTPRTVIAVAAAGFLPFAVFADHHKDGEIEHTHKHTHDADHQHDSNIGVGVDADTETSYRAKGDKRDRNRYGANDSNSNSDRDRKWDSNEARAVTFNQLDGRDIIGEDGDKLGSVADAVVDLSSGEIDSFILSTGFWGMGSEYRIKADRFSGLLDESGRERVNLTKNDLKDMKDFDKSSLKDNRKLGVVSDIIGEDVEGESGGFAGTVEDVLVDPKRGSVPYIIVRQMPSPISSIRFDYFAVKTSEVKGMKNGEMKLSINDGKLESAPMLSSETDLKWKDGENIYRYNASR